MVPRQVSLNAPGFGYYYPSRIYQLPAKTPGFQQQAAAPAGMVGGGMVPQPGMMQYRM